MSLPMYLKIKNQMIKEIEDLNANDPVPSERVLAETYGASRMTVRRAIDELVDEGLLYRDAKRGTFVADKKSARRNTLFDMLENETLDYKVLYFDVKATSSEAVQYALNIRPSDQVVRMVRLALNNQEPTAIEEIYIERLSISDEDFNKMTKWKSFNHFLTKDSVITQRFLSTIVPVQYARLLKVPIGSAILVIDNFISNKQGDKIGYVRFFHNTEKGHIEITS